MSAKSIDRRSFVRIPFKTEVEIDAQGTVVRCDGGIDISMSGLRAFCSGSLPEGAPCRATIPLGALQNSMVIEATGRIIRSGRDHVALEFTELDVDSYNHLKQLILNNAEDPEKAEEEFDAHWGIRRPA